jgi:hypothetical protein
MSLLHQTNISLFYCSENFAFVLAACLQALVVVMRLVLQRFILLHYEQSKPRHWILVSILQFADFIRLQAHRNQLRFSDKL